MPEVSDDGEKYCQGPKCANSLKRPAVKICHHTECQENNEKRPLLLCDDCDGEIHTGQAVCHLRFQLPKNFKRTASIRSTNSDSGNEEEAEPKQHFDKKNKGYASARRFFNPIGNQGKKKVSKGKDPGRELLRVRFYERGSESPHHSEVLPALKGKSLKDSMAPLFEAYSLSFDTHSVFLDSSNTPLPLAFESYPLGGNVLHVRAINDVNVDKRIIELAKQSYNKEKETQVIVKSIAKGCHVAAVRWLEHSEDTYVDTSQDSIMLGQQKDRGQTKNNPTRRPDKACLLLDPHLHTVENQKSKKNIFQHFGDERAQSFDHGRNAPQRRSGMYEMPNLGDVTRSFNDILDYYSANGIKDDDDTDNVDDLHVENNDFFMEDSWTHVIVHPPELSKKLKDEQEAIWELLTTESNYLRKLHLIQKLFLRGLRSLQKLGHLQDIDIDQLFGNITEVWEANLSLWSNYLKPILEKAREDKSSISPIVFRDGFAHFGLIMEPYKEYCLNEAQCLDYLKSNRAENEKFRTYLAWCENHTLCNRLKLTDLLVKPMQRLTKYPLLLKAISKKTQHQYDKDVVQEMIHNVERFVCHINSALRIRHEQKKTQAVVERLDTYMPVEPVNDEVEKILMDIKTFDLNGNVPFISETEWRCVLMEGPMKLAEKQNRADVYCFLFTDIFLITKGKRSNEKYKILKQPFRLTKVFVKPLKESGGFLFVYLNEYGSLVTAFVLQPPPTETNRWINNIEKAKHRLLKARAGNGSTYEFFDDDVNSSFAFASPHHSPNQERRPSWQQKFVNAHQIDMQPSIVITDQIHEQRKPRSYSIEPRRVTSPHTETSKLSESFDTGNKVARSVSDSKKDKAEAARPLENARYWQGERPVSMIVPSKDLEDIGSFVMNEKRSRSDSLESPPDDMEPYRNESFRSTSSDTVLSRADIIRNELRRQIKPSSSAPEVSKVSSGVQRRHSDGASDTRYSRRSMRSQEPSSISVSSSNTSISTERGALSRDNSFKNRHRDITELDEGSHDDSAMGRSTPSFFLELEDNAEVKDSTVDDANFVSLLVDQDCQTEPPVVVLDSYCQTDADSFIVKVDGEVQTDFDLSNSGIVPEEKVLEEAGTQCDLIQRVFDCGEKQHQHHAINFQRTTSINDDSHPYWKLNYHRTVSLGERAYTLRSCYSEIDLRESQIQGLHYRSLSEDCDLEIATDANGNHAPPRIRKRRSSSGANSPGMLALQSLSNSLESSMKPKLQSESEKEALTQRRSSSPLSLRKVALLNSSPVPKRRGVGNRKDKSVIGLNSMRSKRATWHADSVTELEKLEKELLRGSKDDLSVEKGINDVRIKGEEKPKRPERKKNKGNKKDEKKKRKKDGESHGVVSGPNMDKRKAHRVLLENSLMHEKPELV